MDVDGAASEEEFKIKALLAELRGKEELRVLQMERIKASMGSVMTPSASVEGAASRAI